MNKVIKFIYDKIGWGGIIVIFLFIAVYAYMMIKVKHRKENADYVKGISLGIDKGVHGSLYLNYSFKANDSLLYKGNMPDSFCDSCKKCCIKGDTVIVRYENGNPTNNDLVPKLPEGETLQ
jgi:hypothetical protein